MKKLIFTLLISFFALNAVAQKDVTKFLGIPVDGTKAEMIRKLKAKGFKEIPYSDGILEGEFNGFNVNIFLQTNNNKVWRVAVADQNGMSSIDIKTRFNNLYYQFNNNTKYITVQDFTIPESEDIGYETLVNNKKYRAVFYQQAENITTDFAKIASMKQVWFTILKNNGEYTLVIYYENLYNKANGEDL